MYLPGPIRFAKCQVCSRCMIVHKNMTRTWQDHSNTSAVQLQSRVRTVSRHTNACESAECPRLGAIVSAGLRSRPPCTRTLLENGRTLGPPGPPCGLLYTRCGPSSESTAHTPGQRNHILYIVSFAPALGLVGIPTLISRGGSRNKDVALSHVWHGDADRLASAATIPRSCAGASG